jgi:hypothetical protein
MAPIACIGAAAAPTLGGGVGNVDIEAGCVSICDDEVDEVAWGGWPAEFVGDCAVWDKGGEGGEGREDVLLPLPLPFSENTISCSAYRCISSAEMTSLKSFRSKNWSSSWLSSGCGRPPTCK